MPAAARLSLVFACTLISTATFADTNARLNKLEHQAQQLQREIQSLKHRPLHSKQANLANGYFLHSATVTTSPLQGRKSAYNASDVIKQQASIEEDLDLLQARQAFLNQLSSKGTNVKRPIIELSGGLEGQLFYSDGGFSEDAQDMGINLATAELDTQIIASNWVSGLFSIDYNNAPFNTGNRAPQATLYLARGFITLGDLNKSPFYFSIGQQYVPFGQYSSAMVTAGLTRSLGRILSPTAAVGYYRNGLNLAAFSYSGSQTSGGSPVFKQGGARIGYTRSSGANKFSFSASYVSNIADSQGMQGNGLTASITVFGGFSFNDYTGPPSQGNFLQHAVGGGDLSASATFGKLTFLGEYTTALSDFNRNDLTFNGSPAQPKALSVEADYALQLANKPVVIGVGYDRSWQAVALNIPEQSFRAVFNISWFKNTVEALEYRHDTNYSPAEINGSEGHNTHIVLTPAGQSRNSVIAQLGVYF